MRLATPARRRIARAGRIAGVLACLLVLLGPTGAAQAQDPSKNLLGDSPMCGEDECASGVSWRPYDRSHYGLDEWSDPGITDVPEVGNYLIHLVVGWIWQGALWIMDGILMLLEWAFSLTLINEDTLPKLATGLEDMHEDFFGTSWFLAALAILGLWGLYHGLVRMRTIQTLGGLAGAVLLMCCALIIIENPKGTIGEFTDFVNDGALGILALGASGSTDNAEETYQNTSERLFELVITDPWCALQFASVNFCKRTDNDENILVKDAWLRWDANSDEEDRSRCSVNCPPGGNEGSRGEEYEALKAAAGENQEGYSMERVQYMEGDGAIPRMGLLLLILAGLVGAGALFFFLALQLIAAGVMTLLLVMATPVMLFAPAFGETGRKAFGTWAKRLAGAIIAKLVYALFLAIVIFCANIITSMGPTDDLAPGEESGELSWGALWLVFTVFWWTVLIKRDQLLGFVTGNQPGGFGLLKAALGMRLAKDAIGGAVGKATYLPRKGAGALWKRRPHPTGCVPQAPQGEAAGARTRRLARRSWTAREGFASARSSRHNRIAATPPRPWKPTRLGATTRSRCATPSRGM